MHGNDTMHDTFYVFCTKTRDKLLTSIKTIIIKNTKLCTIT